MKKIFIFYLAIGLFTLVHKIYSQQQEGNPNEGFHTQNIHKYLTYQSWQMVLHEHPEAVNSEMDFRMGGWQDGSINGNKPWEKGKVITGAYREDEEDVVFKHQFLTPTSTHFWDADLGDDETFNPPPYTTNYENSYQKVLAFWNGNVGGEAWLDLGPFFYNLSPFWVRVKYNDLASVLVRRKMEFSNLNLGRS